jgi:hypothetical protein
MPVIPDTRERERLGGLQLEASLGKKLSRLLLNQKQGMVAHSCNLSYWEPQAGDSRSKAGPGAKS